jgi:hypothetical protein
MVKILMGGTIFLHVSALEIPMEITCIKTNYFLIFYISYVRYNQQHIPWRTQWWLSLNGLFPTFQNSFPKIETFIYIVTLGLHNL